MHDCGLLGQMFPEFKAINCRVVRDFYHKYTVDEHTLLTIRNLERLIEPSGPERERFAPPARRAWRRRNCWCCRCSFTTSASGRDEDHAVESARMAQQMFERLDLDPDAAEPWSSSWCREHLKMSLVAFRRDTEDPEIVRQFGDLVGVEERLKMLVPHDAGRCRGGQPRDVDAVEGRAAVAALRRHLQLPDALLRRRGDRPRTGRSSSDAC